MKNILTFIIILILLFIGYSYFFNSNAVIEEPYMETTEDQNLDTDDDSIELSGEAEVDIY